MTVFHNIKFALAKLIDLPSHPRVFGLDLMRTIAILAVILTHIQMMLPSYIVDITQKYINPGAAMGVELFFVLSGFLIGSILLSLEPKFNNVRGLFDFWQRRWFRTLPNYYLFLAIIIIQFMFLNRPFPNIFQYLTFTQNWLWRQPSFFGPSWSLAIEEWFYFLFPISLFLIYRLSKSFTVAFLASTALFIIVPTLARIQWVGIAAHNNWDEDFRKVMFIRLDAIMYGVLAAWLRKRFPFEWRKLRFLFFAAGFAIVLFSWFLVGQEARNTSFFAKVFFLSLLSLGFSFTLPIFEQWQISKENPITRAIRLIALWSYSLYLCNLPMIQIITMIRKRNFPASENLDFVFFILAFIAIFLFSSIVYTYYEKPITGLREKFSKASDKPKTIVS